MHAGCCTRGCTFAHLKRSRSPASSLSYFRVCDSRAPTCREHTCDSRLRRSLHGFVVRGARRDQDDESSRLLPHSLSCYVIPATCTDNTAAPNTRDVVRTRLAPRQSE